MEFIFSSLSFSFLPYFVDWQRNGRTERTEKEKERERERFGGRRLAEGGGRNREGRTEISAARDIEEGNISIDVRFIELRPREMANAANHSRYVPFRGPL